MSNEPKRSLFGLEPDQLNRLFSLGTDHGESAESENKEAEPPQPADSTEPSNSSDFTASLQSSVEQIGQWIGPYKLVHMLGEGGMGVVYLAQQEQPIRRQLALKVIKPGMDTKSVIVRFEAERQALALLDHPNIAHVYQAGMTEAGRPYFVMEYVKGLPITEFCDHHKLTIENRLGLFLQVCQAMQHAHQKGIIHRDIKPSNILVSEQQDKAIPKIIDFGVAKAINQSLTERTFYTEQGQLMGTPEYMSPEQANMATEDVDTRSDIYSLGMLLYVLLTGVLPFDTETLREGGIEHIRKVISKRDPVTPSTRLSKTSLAESTESSRLRRTDARTLQHKLHGDLDWITLKALEKNPARRYSTVDAFAEDLRRHLNHQPVSAVPPGLLYRSQKFIRRYRRQVVAAAMVMVACLAIGIAAVMSVRASRERAHAEALEHRQLLDQAQELFGTRNPHALATVSELLQSPYVGRSAKLLHAQLLLEEQGSAAAFPELERLLGIPDEVAGQAHFLLAGIYYEGDPCAPGETSEFHQRWQEHREQAEQLIAGTAPYYFLRAQAAYGVKEMLEMLDQALKLDKQHYDSLRERAHIYYIQHDYEKMIRDAARMIGIRPDKPQGYALSALALQELGRLDEALQDHNEAIQLAPEDPHLYDGRRETYTRLGQYEPALRDAEKCAELRPRYISYRHKLFAVYTALGRYDEAQREYEHFLNSSVPVLQENRIGGVPWYLRGLFYLFSSKLVAESVAADRMWHGPCKPPNRAPYAWMYECDAYYRNLHTQAQCLVPKGFHPAWSPDGRRLAYSHGLLSASGVAVLDVESGRTELLTTSGQNPEWSPDGRTIAFERNRRIWSTQSLASLSVRTYLPDGRVPRHADEVWIVDMVTHEVRRICEGTCPRWGRRSGRLYYTSRQNNTLYSVSLAHTDARPVEVLSPCGPSPVISPDEQYIADHTSRELRIIDADSKEVVATWIAPPSPLGDLNVSWSPDGGELSISGSNVSEIGLWIYDIETGEASKILNGGWFTSCWTPDSSKMALSLVVVEIWQVDLEPGVPTVASFDSLQTIEEHCLDLMERLNHYIPMDPALVHWQYLRADCALWMDHPKAAEYLQQFEQVLPPYKAANCAREARWMLDATPELRDRLLPLALLLARKAVEKEPENTDFLRTLGEALYHTEDREHAEAILLRAFDLSIAASDPHDPKTAEIMQLLIQLYESWDKAEKAEEWRAKLPQTKTVEQ